MSQSARSTTLPKPRTAAADISDDSPVVVGIRPEDVRLDGVAEFHQLSASDGDQSCWEPLGKMSVQMVEPLGAFVDVRLENSAKETLVARLPSTVQVANGDILKVFVDVSKAHVFAADDNGRRLN